MDATAQARIRWFRLTPGRFVLLLLAVEVLLWLSDRFGWLGWHKGYAVLTGVAVMGVAMILMVGWFVVALILRRRFQFRIRSLLVLVVAVAVPCSWLAAEIKKARKQREEVLAVERSGGWVRYDYEYFGAQNVIQGTAPSRPAWLFRLLGDDFTTNVIEAAVYNDTGLKCVRELSGLQILTVGVGPYVGELGVFGKARRHAVDPKQPDRYEMLVLGDNAVPWPDHVEGFSIIRETAVTDAALGYIVGLPYLQKLTIGNCPITDSGLEQLENVKTLQRLRLLPYNGNMLIERSKITDAGVAKLQQALPNCKIIR